MDQIDTKSERSVSSEQDIPKIPIKTYQWEDVRRSRKRGGYPWTHFDKGPFNEEEDPEDYTMDAFRKSRSRSTSTIGKSELNRELSVEPETITEKTEPTTVVTQLEVPGTSRKVQEDPKKKRKLSIESSYSRISLSKLGVMDKLKEVKNKIKMPKLPRRAKSDLTEERKPKKFRKPSKQKEEIEVKTMQAKNVKPVYIHIPLKPPPGETDEFSKYEFEEPQAAPIEDGQKKASVKRSFGDLVRKAKLAEEMKIKMEENEQINQEEVPETSMSGKEETGAIPKSCIQPTTNLERKESGRLTIEELTASMEERASNLEDSQKSKSPEPTVDEPDDSSVDDSSQCLDKDDRCEIISEMSESLEKIEPIPSAYEEAVEITFTQTRITTTADDIEKISENQIDVTIETEYDPIVPTTSTEEEVKTQEPLEDTARQTRAKSEEPTTRKRKSSIDSTFSRKSLSKLAFIKKLKDAKDKIKLPKFPSFSKGDKKKSKVEKEEKKEIKATEKKEVKATEKKEKKDKPRKRSLDYLNLKKTNDKPVYIYIPLKLPPGETDEFSKYADDNYKEEKIVEEKDLNVEDESKPTTPESPRGKGGVQLIILTPPSDDEILDGSSVPDTPSESGEKFFENVRIGDLKTLAKTALDSVYPSTSKLETVTEDEDSESRTSLDVPEEDKSPGSHAVDDSKMQKLFFDEEDGLKLNEEAMKLIREESSALADNQQDIRSEGSPALKKKVSFKKRAKSDNGEQIYEDVIVEPKSEQDETVKIVEESIRTSPEDEKTSVGEDRKWSKLNDHEYEPISPPLESTGPTVIITQPLSTDGSTTSLERRLLLQTPTEEMMTSSPETQSRAEERLVTTPETVSSRTDGEFNTSQFDSSAIETLPLQKECRKNITKTKTTTKTDEPGKGINETIRSHTNKIKTKLQAIKKPTISFTSTKVKKTTTAKKPTESKINFPSFSLQRKKPSASSSKSKTSWRQRQFSTESNVGDSKKKTFDFSTFPRIFDRKKKKSGTSTSSSKGDTERDITPPPPVEFATVPRTYKTKGSRWDNKFKDLKYADEDARQSKEYEERTDSIRIPLHPDGDEPEDVPSHTRYNEDIDIDDDYDRENRDIHRVSPFSEEYLKRWDHGEFHEGPPSPVEFERETKPGSYKITDLDNYDDQPQSDSNLIKDGLHSSGSLSEPKRGVLEEIDSDEFFLREKGISQENIEVGKYLSSEIREAFRNPVNSLSQLQNEDHGYDIDLSDRSESLHDSPPRRKPMKKPKRKRTPHVSSERLSYDQETEPEEYPKSIDQSKGFAPPARPKRKSKKSRKRKFDNVVPYQETISIQKSTPATEISSRNILGELEDQIIQTEDNDHNFQETLPPVPARKHKSLKSLNNSDHDSILDELSKYKDVPDQEFEAYRIQQEYIIPTPEPPTRRHKSRQLTRSPSATTSQLEDDRTSRGAESLVSDNQIPCIEEPCVQDIRDYMGYAVIDKSKAREPPLPPPRIPSTPPRRKRSISNEETKFFTAPRSFSNEAPMRPLRNYSTLGPNRPPRRSTTSVNEDEKENSFGDDESARRLQSGDIIRKMRERPLPAPPRPPRRTRDKNGGPLSDITHESNQATRFYKKTENETEDASPSEPIDGDYLKESVFVENNGDTKAVEEQIVPDEQQETVTHGTLLVQPMDVQFLSYSQLHKNRNQQQNPPEEHIIPISYEDEETSEIPEEFAKLKDPPSKKIENQEIGVIKADRVQASDMDVNKLKVNELQASKIIVSELEGVSIQVSEINSKGGNLVVSGIELAPHVLQNVLDQIQSHSQPASTPQTPENSENPEQKKTPIEEVMIESYNPIDNIEKPPSPPNTAPLQTSLTSEESVQTVIAPSRPPRKSSDVDLAPNSDETSPDSKAPQSPIESETSPKDEDPSSPTNPSEEEPPPRPPRPILLEDGDYMPSQPPPSFYALRYPNYIQHVEEDIPLAPRRKRQPRAAAPPISSSSSEELPTNPRRHSHRSPEPTIPQLSRQLVRQCVSETDRVIRRLILEFRRQVLLNEDGKQDMHVMILILLVLIAGLILIGGDQRVTVHRHQWEFFNPPKDL